MAKKLAPSLRKKLRRKWREAGAPFGKIAMKEGEKMAKKKMAPFEEYITAFMELNREARERCRETLGMLFGAFVPQIRNFHW